MAVWLHCLVVAMLLGGCALADLATQGETPAWTREEMYRDMFPLGQSNFSEAVLRSGEAWIVLFHQGSLERAWKSLAVTLRGIVWFGLVHTDQETTLLKEIKYEKANGSRALVFPHGPGKAARWRATSDPETAKVMATDSLPDMTLDVRAVGLEDFVVDSLMARPSRFPALLLTEEEGAGPLWRALAYRLRRHFQFGRLARPELDDVRGLGLGSLPPSLPHLLVLTTTAPRGAQPDFRGVPYTSGPLLYPDLLRFLYVVNRDFRHLLFGANLAERQEEVEMAEVLRVEARRFDLKGVTSDLVTPPDLQVSVTHSEDQSPDTQGDTGEDSNTDHDEL